MRVKLTIIFTTRFIMKIVFLMIFTVILSWAQSHNNPPNINEVQSSYTCTIHSIINLSTKKTKTLNWEQDLTLLLTANNTMIISFKTVPNNQGIKELKYSPKLYPIKQLKNASVFQDHKHTVTVIAPKNIHNKAIIIQHGNIKDKHFGYVTTRCKELHQN